MSEIRTMAGDILEIELSGDDVPYIIISDDSGACETFDRDNAWRLVEALTDLLNKTETGVAVTARVTQDGVWPMPSKKDLEGWL